MLPKLEGLFRMYYVSFNYLVRCKVEASPGRTQKNRKNKYAVGEPRAEVDKRGKKIDVEDTLRRASQTSTFSGLYTRRLHFYEDMFHLSDSE